MRIIKRDNRTIISILSDDKRMLIKGGIQGTLISDLWQIGKYTNYDGNPHLKIDLITLDGNIKILGNGKMKFHVGDSVIKLNCYYAPWVPCSIISQSWLI